MKDKVLLHYSLTELPGNKLAFQIIDQAPEVDNYLKKNNFRDSETGLLVAAANFPEFKESKNEIFLRGLDKAHDNKIDITRFVGPMQLANKKAMFNTALKNFIKAVRKGTPANSDKVDTSSPKPEEVKL